YQDHGIGEAAARNLSELWPNRYEFDMLASPRARNRARIICQNTWLAAHHLAPIPVPPALTNRVGTNDANKIFEIEWTTNSMPARPAFAARIARLKGKMLSSEIAKLLSE